jgi:hypothetical protein
LAFEGDTVQFTNIAQAISYLRQKKRTFLTVIDEAHKYYVKNGSPLYEWSKDCVYQLYALGIAGGSTCFLCGSSTKLTCLALPYSHKSGTIPAALLEEYPGYTSINDQKFTPTVLPPIKRSELGGYLQFLGYPSDEQAISQKWIQTAGSLRYIIKNEELSSYLPSFQQKHAVLLWLYSQQTTQDPNQLKMIPFTVICKLALVDFSSSLKIKSSTGRKMASFHLTQNCYL